MIAVKVNGRLLSVKVNGARERSEG